MAGHLISGIGPADGMHFHGPTGNSSPGSSFRAHGTVRIDVGVRDRIGSEGSMARQQGVGKTSF